MRRPAERCCGRSAGFILPVVLGLVVVAGLLAVSAASDVSTSAALSTSRLLHQRAFEAASTGAAAALETLESGGAMPPASQRLESAAMPTDHADVRFDEVAIVTMPAGFSAGRVFERYFEVTSTGHSARNTEVTQVQGLSRLEPQALR